MFSFASVRIGTKLGLAFTAMIVLAVLQGGAALQRISAMGEGWAEFERVTLGKDGHVNVAAGALGDGVHHFKNFILRGGDYAKRFEGDMAAIEKTVADYRALGTISETEDKLLKSIAANANAYRLSMGQLVDMRAKGASIADLDKAVAGADKQIAADLGELRKLQKAMTKAESAEFASLLSQARYLVIGMAALLVVAGVAFSIVITRSIVRPIAGAVEVARRVSSGDLTVRIESSRRDEAGELLGALQTMTGDLTRIIEQVRTGTQAIGVASSEIASGNQDLSQRTEEQASSLEETASSMEQLTTTVKQNAESARQGNHLAAVASEVAEKGGAVVGRVVTTMGEINSSSRKIADIIGVIDGIAFQTNILALNAAVEAARAGEQGRGFAVVAAEVRNLAQRSAGAAKEIKALIEDSVTKVDTGAKLVDQAGATMAEVVTSIKHVTNIIAEIAAASQEQSSGIEQVNQAIAQMDHVTQQNAALVEQAAAAAEAMKDQAQQLAGTVAVFKIADTGAKGVVAPDLTHAAGGPRSRAGVDSAGNERRNGSPADPRGPNVMRLERVARPTHGGTSPAAAERNGTNDAWAEF